MKHQEILRYLKSLLKNNKNLQSSNLPITIKQIEEEFLYSKNEIIKLINEAPDVDYVGEFLKTKLDNPFSKK